MQRVSRSRELQVRAPSGLAVCTHLSVGLRSTLGLWRPVTLALGAGRALTNGDRASSKMARNLVAEADEPRGIATILGAAIDRRG